MFLYNMRRSACESTPFVYLLYTYLLGYQHLIYTKKIIIRIIPDR